ncbi:FMN-dependent NADH-azoreductase [Lichenihabitans psoromatis]|uniref:FMN-dependent NADH-azoreductase n=1 Tax=Lichenihabitans psoromatis TaxID=2528642 RepID=UPI001FE0DBB8|nr:NAD(P)H-dependent oxidoreductase [Lichenihabitans psoromatis]
MSTETMSSPTHTPRLLHVEASPRKQRSASLEVAAAFIAAWKTRHPEAVVDVLDVWTTDLPPFDGEALEAKYAGLEGRALSPAQTTVWAEIDALAERFRQASLIVLSVPMWNFGIPYRLKHLIDAISQKDILFTFDERGLKGMLGGRKAVVVDARGVGLGPDFPRDLDHQQSYMTAWLQMIGITDITHIEVEKTLMGAEVDHAARAKAREQAARLGATL